MFENKLKPEAGIESWRANDWNAKANSRNIGFHIRKGALSGEIFETDILRVIKIGANMQQTLSSVSHQPDWHYVLQEFYRAYRYGSAGGSAEIRRHQREVQRRISRCLAKNSDIIDQPPQTKPVCAHLGRAFNNGEQERTHTFIRALEKIADTLVWQYGYDKLPRSREKNTLSLNSLAREDRYFVKI